MIADYQADKVYFSGLLPRRYKVLFAEIKSILERNGIPFGLIPETKDIWCRDYMPIQSFPNSFIQFDYSPDYLLNDKDYHTITDTRGLLPKIGIDKVPYSPGVVLDGGNLVKSQTKAILTDKIFDENPDYGHDDLKEKIARTLDMQVQGIIIILKDESDMFGHSDGMVRFIDEENVFVNDYSEEKHFQEKFEAPLIEAGLNLHRLPYNPYKNKTTLSAKGIYSNYLEVGNHIIVPAFGAPQDTIAKYMISQYTGKQVHKVNCNRLALQGGLLNCVSWTVELGCEE